MNARVIVRRLLTTCLRRNKQNNRRPKHSDAVPPLRLECLEGRALPAAPIAAMGPLGIDARDIGGGLTGKDVNIGMIETSRAMTPADAVYHSYVKPFKIFNQDEVAKANVYPNDITEANRLHATMVAGTMIANGNDYKGAAPEARLFSAGTSRDDRLVSSAEGTLLAAQYIAGGAGGQEHMTSINYSGAVKLTTEPLDGTGLLAKGMDYLSSRHATIFVLAHNNDRVSTKYTPQDAYNVIVTGGAIQSHGQDKPYDKVAADYKPQYTADGRSMTDIIAPWDYALTLPNKTGGVIAATYNDKALKGNSFAAPLVNGTIALLEQYAANPDNNVSLEFAQPEAIKAIILNSADKVAGRIGMGRTVLRQDGEPGTIRRPPTSRVGRPSRPGGRPRSTRRWGRAFSTRNVHSTNSRAVCSM